MYCSNCGKKIQDEANFCMYCGNKVDRSNEVAEEHVVEEVIEKEEPIVETETMEKTIADTEIVEESNEETIVENSEEVKQDDVIIPDVNNDIVDAKVEDIKDNNVNEAVETKDDDKVSVLSVAFVVNIIYAVFKVISFALISIVMNSNNFNIYLLQILRYYGVSSGNFSFIKILMYALMILSLVFSGVVTVLEYKVLKNKSKGDMIVAFILSCIMYGYLCLTLVVSNFSSFSIFSLLLIVAAAFMIVITYKALQEVKD